MSARQQKSPVPGEAAALPVPVGRRIAHHMQRRELDIDVLAARTGLDADGLGRIIDGEWQPTIDLLWKIANALDVRPGSLVAYGYTPEFALSRAGHEPRLASPDGGYVSRALSPFQCGKPFELYGIDMAAGTCQQFEAHPPGTFETLTIHHGDVEIVIGKEPPRRLRTGDWVQFQADVPHSYRNLGGGTASLYLVIAYQLSGNA
ncbi:XRE family transcriptional regulator [Novosphingobium resinovorum]|uniref:helix-turn-helix domain-containing protein n=1 Tax=Novosphingobium resinovorum TaxID=158500 RepID=UPI002ED0B26F|nr:XRE family transcriptional regulator [Novosphingobium resinovorum]